MILLTLKKVVSITKYDIAQYFQENQRISKFEIGFHWHTFIITEVDVRCESLFSQAGQCSSSESQLSCCWCWGCFWKADNGYWLKVLHDMSFSLIEKPKIYHGCSWDGRWSVHQIIIIPRYTIHLNDTLIMPCTMIGRYNRSGSNWGWAGLNRLLAAGNHWSLQIGRGMWWMIRLGWWVVVGCPIGMRRSKVVCS